MRNDTCLSSKRQSMLAAQSQIYNLQYVLGIGGINGLDFHSG